MTKKLKIVSGDTNHEIAFLQQESQNEDLGVFWLGGFKSSMLGSKANYLNEFAKKHGLEFTRFDYCGHGLSGGKFIDGTISKWLEEALAIFELTKGSQIIVGSSMGGWLALLLNRILLERGKNRIKAMVLIAPAIDMTKDLMSDKFSSQELEQLEKNGFIEQPSDYEEPYIITKKLIDDGEKHLLFGKGSIFTSCPIHILQGKLDDAVPVEHALKLMSHITNDECEFSLIPNGNHSLSSPKDLENLGEVILNLVDK